MTNSNRDAFLEKFREQQGLSFISSNTNQNEINKSKISNISEGDGRWEYLYQLEKLKKIKIEEIRKQNQRDNLQKEYKECTFTPKLNKNRGSSYKNIISTANNSLLNLNNSKNTLQNSIVNTEGNNPNAGLNEDNLYINYNLQGDIHQRQKIWNSKKNSKIEEMKIKSNEKEIEECFFKPKIVKNIFIF